MLNLILTGFINLIIYFWGLIIPSIVDDPSPSRFIYPIPSYNFDIFFWMVPMLLELAKIYTNSSLEIK